MRRAVQDWSIEGRVQSLARGSMRSRVWTQEETTAITSCIDAFRRALNEARDDEQFAQHITAFLSCARVSAHAVSTSNAGDCVPIAAAGSVPIGVTEHPVTAVVSIAVAGHGASATDSSTLGPSGDSGRDIRRCSDSVVGGGSYLTEATRGSSTVDGAQSPAQTAPRQ